MYGEKNHPTGVKGSYDPTLQTSVIKMHKPCTAGTVHPYGNTNGGEKGCYDPPLPTSVIKERSQISKPMESGIDTPYGYCKGGTIGNVHGTNYDPPLPTIVLQFKSERGKYKTQKPTTMMDWILKYYSKEGDTVLDPTMGSCSMGVACKSTNREFIGIERDEEIYKVACERLK